MPEARVLFFGRRRTRAAALPSASESRRSGTPASAVGTMERGREGTSTVMQHVWTGIAAAAVFATGLAIGGGAFGEQDAPKPPAGQDAKKPADKKPAPAAEAEGMFPKPSPEHAVLARDEGTWSFKQKMLDPATMAWTESSGVETIKMDCGGLWQCSEFDCQAGANKGFRGRGTVGYDVARKQYVGTWVDATTTAPFYLTGAYDAAKKKMVMDAIGSDPQGGELKMKMTTTFVDEKRRTFSVSFDQGGKDMEIMTVEYERK
jgi:hypothetical protein